MSSKNGIKLDNVTSDGSTHVGNIAKPKLFIDTSFSDITSSSTTPESFTPKFSDTEPTWSPKAKGDLIMPKYSDKDPIPSPKKKKVFSPVRKPINGVVNFSKYI